MRQLIVSEAELAKHWGVTERRVRQLAEEQIAIRSGGGYDLAGSDSKFINYLRSDEETAQLRRRALAAKTAAFEQKLARSDRELLTPEEIQAVCTEAVSYLWTGARGWVSNVLHQLHFAIPDEAQFQTIAISLTGETAGLMRQIESIITNVVGSTKESSARRKLSIALMAATRQVRFLEAELGGSSVALKDGVDDADEESTQ